MGSCELFPSVVSTRGRARSPFFRRPKRTGRFSSPPRKPSSGVRPRGRYRRLIDWVPVPGAFQYGRGHGPAISAAAGAAGIRRSLLDLGTALGSTHQNDSRYGIDTPGQIASKTLGHLTYLSTTYRLRGTSVGHAACAGLYRVELGQEREERESRQGARQPGSEPPQRGARRGASPLGGGTYRGCAFHLLRLPRQR